DLGFLRERAPSTGGDTSGAGSSGSSGSSGSGGASAGGSGGTGQGGGAVRGTISTDELETATRLRD
ncbi:MAG: hypothetical protein AAGG08_12595, partial [Actinomycetota bacterium]